MSSSWDIHRLGGNYMFLRLDDCVRFLLIIFQQPMISETVVRVTAMIVDSLDSLPANPRADETRAQRMSARLPAV